jgi:GT2 family glycosyltransferase
MQETHDAPSVLAVLVARNGAPWIRSALSSLARQTHPRLGVLAVDNASSDGTGNALERVLGRRRVLRLDRDLGFTGAVRRALEVPAAAEADFVLLMHDDVVLAPEAVERMVAAARRLEGVGVVGPKVLDWGRPRMLREVGFSADRFGYPHSPVEEGELDQGQYDAPREVLFVSSAAMLVSRSAWSRAGLPDERLTPADGDLELGWRMRLSGFRVMVAPEAVIHHRAATGEGERADAPPVRVRYRTERAALVALLTNCRLVTLLWVLPLYAVQGLGRLALYLLSRRLDRAGDLTAAWWWNVSHLPGTVRRRVRAQAVRRVPDREIGRFLSPATARLTRWAQQAGALVMGRRIGWVEEGEELEAAPLPTRVASVVATHPVAVASIAAVLFTLVAFRGVLFVPHIEGGAIPAVPDAPAGFFRALVEPWRSTGFGGPEAPSPALVPWGVASVVTLGDPDLLLRLAVALIPFAAGIAGHVALRRLGVASGPAVVGGIAYALSGLVLWSASEGRIPVAVVLVLLPWLTVRLVTAFAPGGPHRPIRWVVGTAMGLAFALAFFPAVRLSLGLVVVSLLLFTERGGSRVRGTLLSVSVAAVAAALVFPLVLSLSEGGGGTVEGSAPAELMALLRLSPGDGPGAGPAALFLPVAGLIGFVLADGRWRRAAWRALVVATAGVPLALLAAAGYLPEAVSSPLAFLAASTMSWCFLVALGTASLSPAVRRAAFGLPQLVGAALVAVVLVGGAAQALQAMVGTWGVGEERLLPAWPVVAGDDAGTPFRVLWLAEDDGLPFPPPGGDPEGRVATADDVVVAYGVTGRRGRSVTATALPSTGPPYDRLEDVLGNVLSARLRHGGALLAPFGIRYVVVGEGHLPAPVSSALGEQVDLDLVQRAGGLFVYRNATASWKAAVFPGPEALDAAGAVSILGPLRYEDASSEPLARGDRTTWSGPVPETPSLVIVADRYDPGWRAGRTAPFPAFGWALGFPAEAGSVEVRHDGGPRRAIELTALAALWIAALWVVRRRPGAAEDPVDRFAHRAPEPIGIGAR